MNGPIPIYISSAFLIAIAFPLYMIAALARKHAKPSQESPLFFGILIFYIAYLAVVAIGSLNGAFSAITLPPKIIQLTTLPLLLLLMGLVFNLPYYKKLLTAIPANEMVLLHRFRFIGSFFIILWLFGQLPMVFALIAGLGDVITALSSTWVAKQLSSKKANAQKWAMLWNTFGLLDILVTSTTAILLTKASITTGALGVDILAVFPFCFIPAFAPATIIFLHMSIYRKLLVKKFR